MKVLQLIHAIAFSACEKDGTPIPVCTWSPIEYQGELEIRIFQFAGSFNTSKMPTTNLGDYLTGKTIRVVATRQDGTTLAFKAIVQHENWQGDVDYVSTGPPETVTAEEVADTPVVVLGAKE